MKRRFRLSKRTDFERVRRTGKSYAHPLIVLVARPSEQAITRIGVSAGRSVGGAVQRNRAKRRLRACIAPLIPQLAAGLDIALLARKAINASDHLELEAAVLKLLKRAKIIS